MFRDIFTEDVVCLQASCNDWQAAVRKGAELLLKKGVIAESYIEAIINNHKTIGAYMVVAPGIMLAHARPESGSYKNGLSLLTLAEPLEFGSELNDPVSLVFTLATADSESHVKLLQWLMGFLSDEASVKLVTKSQSVAEVMQCIENIKFEEEL